MYYDNIIIVTIESLFNIMLLLLMLSNNDIMLLGDFPKNHSIDDIVLLEYSILLMVMSLLYLWSTLAGK